MDLIVHDESETIHGTVLGFSAPDNAFAVPWTGTFSFLNVHGPESHLIKGMSISHRLLDLTINLLRLLPKP